MNTNYAPEDRIVRKVGQRVLCNGYPGAITRVCDWSPTMVEVRLARGTVCVSFNDLLPLQTKDRQGPTSIRQAEDETMTENADNLLAEIIMGNDRGTRWAVVDTDTDMCVANNLNRDAADRLIDELRQDGRDCFMELAR